MTKSPIRTHTASQMLSTCSTAMSPGGSRITGKEIERIKKELFSALTYDLETVSS